MTVKTTAATAAVICVLSTVVAADEIPQPKVSFSADMHVNVRDRKAVVVKLFNSPTSLRYEFTARGQRRIILVDRLKKRLYVLDPRGKRYLVRPYSKRADLVAQLPPKNPTLEKLGTEKIGQIEVVKYQVKGATHGGAPFNGHIWITRENVIVRLRGFVKRRSRNVQALIEMKKLKIGSIKPDQFLVPPGYRLVKPKPPGK
jgi:hypothetical protein